MKPTEITMQIVKNLGNYEAARLEVTYIINENDDLTQSFVTAKENLEKAFSKAYPKLKNLEMPSKEFDRVCKALFEKKTDLDELKKYFAISDEIIKYLQKNNLI